MAIIGTVSAREHCALRLILWLARTYRTHQSVSLTDVSRAEHISVKYLEQLIRPFHRAGWVTSTRGRHGGYVMVKNPRTVSLKEIITLVEGKLPLLDCLDHDRRTTCGLTHRCPSKKAWSTVQSVLDQTLSNISLAKLLS